MKFRLSKQSQDKVVYIMRGISGSGKSTLSKELGQGGAVFSTDDFFMVDGEYQFDPAFLSEAHFWNKSRAIEAMESGVSPIVIDNTHVEAWEAKPYVEAAQANGYRVEVRETQTPWRFDAEELARRNTHGVPREVIDDMIARWHPDMSVDDIMNSEKPKTAATRTRMLYARVVEAALEDAVQQLGLAPDVAQYIMSIPDRALQGQVFNYARQNPGVTLVDLQQWQPEQKQTIDPYYPYEKQLASQLPQVAQKWALVNLAQLRNRDLNLPVQPGDRNLLVARPDLEEYSRGLATLERLSRTNELADLIRFNENFDINSYDIFEADEMAMEWHDVMAGKGSGQMYAPTDQNLVVYGPNNWSKEEWMGWTIQEVRSENDLAVEGNRVGHCVGGYCKDIESGRSRIFSLRDPQNEPVVTIETDGADSETPWRFKQIQGDGPKSGNVDPRSEYKLMIGEWMKTLDNPHLDYEDENPHYDDLQRNNVYPEDVSQWLDQAISFGGMADYGFDAEDNRPDWDLETMYDAAMHSLRDGGNGPQEYSYRYADDAGETLGSHAIYADMREMGQPQSVWDEEFMRQKGAKDFAMTEFKERFMTKNYKKKGYNKPYSWEYRDEEAKAEAEALIAPYAKPDRHGYTYENDTKEAYYAVRAQQILDVAASNPEVDETLHKHMIEVFDNKSYVGQLMDLAQHKDEEFWDNYQMYSDGDTGLTMPDEDDYVDDNGDYDEAAYQEAYETWEREDEDIRAGWEDEARRQNDDSVFFDAARKQIVRILKSSPIEFPEWMTKYPGSGRSQLQWLASTAASEAAEEQKVAKTWYQRARVCG